MGLYDARRVGDDAGRRDLLERVGSLEARLREVGASLAGVDALIAAQEELAAQQVTLGDHQVELEAQAAAIPLTAITTASRTAYSIPNNSAIQSMTVPWPEGKSKVDVLVNLLGMFNSGGVPFAYLPVWRIRINGVSSPMIRSVLYHMDDYYFSGSFAASVTAGSDFTVDAYVTTGTSTPISATSTNYLSLYALSVAS